MLKLGEINSLKALKQSEFGIHLVDEQLNEVLLPTRFVPEDLSLESTIDVFLYKDADGIITATTQTPKIMLNQYAALEAKNLANFGAFFDWGLEKDLMVPISEQVEPVVIGNKYVLRLYLDEKTNRLAATTKIKSSLEKEIVELEIGQKVTCIPFEDTEIGINVIVDNRYAGILYKNEVFIPVGPGDVLTGYVKKIRPDNKVDISLNRFGYRAVDDNTDKLYATLNANHGKLNLNDKSSPEEIYKQLGMSKKIFKKAVGALYRQKILEITPTGISLREDNCDGE